MRGTPETRPSLLVRLRDGQDSDSWSQFVSLYAPIIFHFLRSRGLQDADASDLTQDILTSVAAAIKDFDYSAQRGSFRGWLFTIVQNRLRNFWRDARRTITGTGDSHIRRFLDDQPDRHNGHADWDVIYERQLFHHAADVVRCHFQTSTWQAFWRTAVDGRPTREVANELGMTPAAVYLAKGRVTARIREQVQLLTDGEP